MDESGGGFIFDGARTDFRVARAEDDRVLFTYDVGGITKQAVIVHDGPPPTTRAGTSSRGHGAISRSSPRRSPRPRALSSGSTTAAIRFTPT